MTQQQTERPAVTHPERIRRTTEIEEITNLHFIHPLASRLVPFFAQMRITPNAVSITGMLFGILAAFAYYHYADLRFAIAGEVVREAIRAELESFTDRAELGLEAFGKADEGVPMATDSIFRLASMSKVVAAAAVMQLFERGLIALHDPISTYLPEFADPKVAVVKDWGVTQLVTAEREITTHDLLTMTAGMTNTWWHRVFEPSVYGVVPQLLKDAGVVDDMSAPATTLEENIKRLAQVPLIASPGTMFDYSNNIDSASKAWLHQDDFAQIHRGIFSNDAFVKSWSCHTGESMSKLWREATDTRMWGAIGKTDYSTGELPALSSVGGKWVN